MREEILIYPSQTPTGRGLMILAKDVTVTSWCCNAPLLSDADNDYRVECADCKEIVLEKAHYSPGFPLEALRHKREPDYWHGWGEYWFGWKELNLEGEGFE